MSGFGLLLTSIAAFMTVVANLLLRHGLTRVPAGPSVVERIHFLVSSASFAFGLTFYVLAMLPWLWVVSREPLGSAYPILVGTTFVLMFLGTMVTQGEPLTAWKSAGAALIVLGIAIAGKT